MPRFMPSSAVRIGAGASLDADRSRRCGIETEDHAGDLGATGSHEPGKSDDLSAANVKVDLSEFFPVRQARHFERRRPQAALRTRRKDVFDRAEFEQRRVHP
jgi:hypothetical protein